MGKPYIVVGDKTSHGGVVVEGAATATINGKPIALVGGKVTCPKKGHGGTTVIIAGDPDFIIEGKPAARHGDKTACGATLIASQRLGFDDDDEEFTSTQPTSAGIVKTAAMGLAPEYVASPATNANPPLKDTANSVISTDSMSSEQPEIDLKLFKNLEHGDLKKVNAIVLHRTGGSTAASTLSNYASTGTGAHFLIDTNGHIYQTISTEKRAAHVGKLRSKCLVTGSCTEDEKKAVSEIWNDGKKSFASKVSEIHDLEIKKIYPNRFPYNEDSIGIEIVGTYLKDSDTYSEATTEQLAATKKLIQYLQSKYLLSGSDIYKHHQISYKSGHEGDGLGY